MDPVLTMFIFKINAVYIKILSNQITLLILFIDLDR